MDDTELIYHLAMRSLENKSNDNARLMRMQLKGAQRFESLLSRHDGDTDVEGAARLLGATTDAIRKRIQRRGLAAYKKGSAVRIPCAQFKDNQVLDGLPEVLKQLPSAEGKAAVLALLTPSDSGKSIIELLREGDKSRAIAEAKHHLQHIGR
ncbi:hypothetical protein CGX12_13390 [Zobellella denitrificans]|nr:hypothetical protein CGX12_13390 [Zobellella denitrificans]